MDDKSETIVGGIIAVLVFGALIYGAVRLIRALVPGPSPVAMSLSAYFEGANLTIGGRAQPAPKGKARIAVKSMKGDYQQSTFVDIKNDGTFGTSAAEMPALRELRRGDPLEISAEVRSDSTGARSAERIYLYTEPPVPLQNPMIGIGAVTLLCIFVFFFAFTGPPSLTKDRTAIILSYCVILLFLILPLGAPVVLPHIWNEGVMDTAVGFIITKVPQKDPGEKPEAQWALNIGGYVNKAAVSDTSGANASPANTPAADAPVPAPENAGNPLAFVPISKEVTVEGGLVIPLYVIILSVIGGAINMTRQVPRIQGAAPESYPSFVRRVFNSLNIQRTGPGQGVQTSRVEIREQVSPIGESKGADTPAGEPAVADAAGPPLVIPAEPVVPAQPAVDNGGDKPEAETPDKTDTKGDQQRTQKWRKELLGLYMYLISAPFLAIVTYYLLWWLDLTKKPILVLVSFSIGLISDQVVDKIIDVVKNALGGAKPKDQPALEA